MFSLSLSPVSGVANAPVPAAPAGTTADFALTLASVAQETAAATPVPTAEALPPALQILAATASRAPAPSAPAPSAPVPSAADLIVQSPDAPVSSAAAPIAAASSVAPEAPRPARVTPTEGVLPATVGGYRTLGEQHGPSQFAIAAAPHNTQAIITDHDADHDEPSEDQPADSDLSPSGGDAPLLSPPVVGPVAVAVAPARTPDAHPAAVAGAAVQPSGAKDRAPQSAIARPGLAASGSTPPTTTRPAATIVPALPEVEALPVQSSPADSVLQSAALVRTDAGSPPEAAAVAAHPVPLRAASTAVVMPIPVDAYTGQTAPPSDILIRSTASAIQLPPAPPIARGPASEGDPPPAPQAVAAAASYPVQIGVAVPALRAFAAGIAATITKPAGPALEEDQLPLLIGASPVAEATAQRIAAPQGQSLPIDMRRQDWTRALIERIDAVRDVANARDTRITLIPDALGKIDVSLRQEGETVHVTFTADVPATRALLADAQPRLADLAEARGLKLGDSSVLTGGTGLGSGSGASTANGFGQANDQRRPALPAQTAQPNRSWNSNTAVEAAESDQRIA